MPVTILLFLKAPRPGLVKTRLAKDLGVDGETTASEIYRKIVKHTISVIPDAYNLHVYFAPKEAENEMKAWLGDDIQLSPQIDGSLGEKLDAACSESFDKNSNPVILLGGDCADITEQHLLEAGDHLLNSNAVIGPALDGGYWLLGLHKNLPGIFKNIPWSKSEVYTETIKRFNELELSPQTLDLLEDIDDLPSLTRASQKHSFISKQLSTI